MTGALTLGVKGSLPSCLDAGEVISGDGANSKTDGASGTGVSGRNDVSRSAGRAMGGFSGANSSFRDADFGDSEISSNSGRKL